MSDEELIGFLRQRSEMLAAQRIEELAAELSRLSALVAEANAEAELTTLRSDNERLGRERDEARAKLFPYADATEISGMSWGGFYLIGDDKSIKELRRIENAAAQIEVYRQAFKERVEAVEAERDTLLAQVEKMRGDEATADRLLSALWRYGNLHTVKGVIYLETGSHADTLKAADDYLYQKAIARAALTKEPS